MKDNENLSKSTAFTKRVVHAYQHLSEQRKERILLKQLLQCGTSIGANVTEAEYRSLYAECAELQKMLSATTKTVCNNS